MRARHRKARTCCRVILLLATAASCASSIPAADDEVGHGRESAEQSGRGAALLRTRDNVERAESVSELRRYWNRAVRERKDTTIEIAPGSHLRLRGRPLLCNQDIRLTIFSSGPGATLDGERRSQIFQLMGCSLVLRGLLLTKGMAPVGLREECRNQSTGVWSPYEGDRAVDDEQGRRDALLDTGTLNPDGQTNCGSPGYDRTRTYKRDCGESVSGSMNLT